MTCFIAQNLLSEYIDGDLTPDRLRELETHLGGCDGCQAELNKTRGVRKMLRSMPIERAPVGFVDRVNAKVASRSPVRRAGNWFSRVFSRPLVYAGAATAAVLVVAIGFMRGGGLIQISDLMGEAGVQESNELGKTQTDDRETFGSADSANLQPEHARQDKPGGIQGEGAERDVDGIQGENGADNGAKLAANRRTESRLKRPQVPDEARPNKGYSQATPAATSTAPAATPTAIAMAKVRDESATRESVNSSSAAAPVRGATSGRSVVTGGSAPPPASDPAAVDRLYESESTTLDARPRVDTEETSEEIVITSEKKWWQLGGKKKGNKNRKKKSKEKQDAKKTAKVKTGVETESRPVPEAVVSKRTAAPTRKSKSAGRSRAARAPATAGGDSFADGDAAETSERGPSSFSGGGADGVGDDLGDSGGSAGAAGESLSFDADGGFDDAGADEPMEDSFASDDADEVEEERATGSRADNDATKDAKAEGTASASAPVITGHVYRVKSSTADAPAQIIAAAQAAGGTEKLWPSGPPQLSEDTKYVTLQIEIPAAKLAEFRAAVGQFGTETLRTQPASDEDPVVLRVSISFQP